MLGEAQMEHQATGSDAEQQQPEGSPFVSSRYNFCVPVEHGTLLYNANSGAVINLSGADSLELAQVLSRGIFEVHADGLPEGLIKHLIAGGFLVPSGTDELALIRERYWKARGDTPMVLTVTTTMNCNLGCYYCYESRTGDKLGNSNLENIVAWVEQRLHTAPEKGLHVDWYGGEPLLNPEFIESASAALQKLCAELKAPFSASVITNGTAWPDDVGEFVHRHRIRQVQVSFDGLRENHNQRRRYRPGYAGGESPSSFDLAVALVDKLVAHTRVDIRLNIDRGNQHDLHPFVDFARARGWFSQKFPAVVQPARLASYSERSSFMRGRELNLSEFDHLREDLRKFAGCDVQIEESEAPDGFPFPKTSVCAALADRSFVMGADGLSYRCGLQVGEKHRAVGKVSNIPLSSAPRESFPDADWWKSFDPTLQPNCARCSFLPICWGGCPKKHLEGDTHALKEQSDYWRRNLPALVATRFGLRAPTGFAYSEADQFR